MNLTSYEKRIIKPKFIKYAQACIPLIATLLLVSFLNKPLFRDEAFSFSSSSQSLSGLLDELNFTNLPYAFYYLIMHFWLAFAKNIVWMRTFSIISYGLSIHYAGKIASGRFNPRIGLFVSIFVATNPLLIQVATYGRPYAFSTLIVCLFFNELLKISQNRVHSFKFFTCLTIALLLLNLFSMIIIVSGLVYIYLSNKNSGTKKLHYSSLLFMSIFSLIYISLLLTQPSGLNWISDYFHSIPLWINLEGPASSSTGLFPIAGSSLYPIGILALLSLGAISYLATRKNSSLRLVQRWDLGLIATWAFLPTVAMVGISLVHPIYITRYITYSVPGLAILMAIACESIYTNFTLIKSKIVKPILFSSVLGAALVWTFITCDIPVAKTYAYNLWAAEKYIASNGGPKAEIVLPTISLVTAITYYANIDHNSFTYWPQGKNIWSATSLNLDQATFAAASSNVWLVYENSYDDAPIVASLREHGYAQTGTTLIEGVALIHFEKH